MVQVTADDLRRRLDDYLRRVAAGEDIIVLDGGRVIARITSAGIPKTPSVVREAAGDSLLGLMRDLGPAPSSEEIDLSRRDAWRAFPRADA